MSTKRPSYLKDAVATPRGYESKRGELLKSIRLTPEAIAEWNGVAASSSKPELLTEAPVVTKASEPVVEDDLMTEATEATEESKKKSKKKSK